jgi:hypothetical protein
MRVNDLFDPDILASRNVEAALEQFRDIANALAEHCAD